jgi:non-specific serine/threonine protein kinase
MSKKIRWLLLLLSAGVISFIVFFCWWNLSWSLPLKEQVTNDAGFFGLRQELPIHRTEASGTVCGNKFYVLGGLDYFMRSFDDLWMYDSHTNEWKKESSLPAPLNHAAVLSDDSLIYVIGGFGPLGFRYRGVNVAKYTPQKAVFAYNPRLRTWTSLSALPEARGAGAAVYLNDTIYYAGGVGLDLNVKNNLWAYCIKTNHWIALKSFHTPRDHHRMEVLNRNLYVISGRQDDLRKTLRSVEVYSLSKQQWSLVDSIPTARGGLSSIVYRNKIYVFGGEFVWSCSDEIDCYDPAVGKWQKIGELPEARHGILSGVIKDTIHLISGGRHSRISVSGIHRTFVPSK